MKSLPFMRLSKKTANRLPFPNTSSVGLLSPIRLVRFVILLPTPELVFHTMPMGVVQSTLRPPRWKTWDGPRKHLSPTTMISFP